MTTFPLCSYLERIAWTGPLSPTIATFSALHRHHVHTFPFENLDSLSGLPVSLEPEALVEKMIQRRRGGYCFEQNGLFLLALTAAGFRTRPLMARVQIAPGRYGIRSHQITLVEIGGARWLADVGFGGNGLVEPIPFELDREFTQPLDRYVLRTDPDYGFRLDHLRPDGWRTLYAFSVDPYISADYAAVNYFICRSPDSTFTQTAICVRTLPTERRIITANQLKVRTASETQILSTLKTTSDFRDALLAHFDLSIPEDFPLPAPVSAPVGLREI